MSALHGQLLTALRDLGGRGTVGDVAARAGLPSHEVEHAMLGALSHVGGHVAVDDHGNLVFSIERTRALPTFRPPLPARLVGFLWSVFRVAFFAALTLTLVIYFVVYLVLILAVLIAGIAAAAKGSDCDCDCDCKAPSGANCDCCGACCDANTCHGCNHAGDGCYAKLSGRKHPERVVDRIALRANQDIARAARAIARSERAKARSERLRQALARITLYSGGFDVPLEHEVVSGKPPFFRAVRDFVFGPLRLPPEADAEMKDLLGFVREHDGRATATDAALVTGLPIEQADRLLLELAVRHGGDVEATEDGAVVYRFDRFMVSAGADLDAITWIDDGPGARKVTVSEFARQQRIPAAEALSRLETLATLAGARAVHGGETTYVFDADAERRLKSAATQHQALRDFRYSWDRLERAPAIIGVPEGGRGWIIGFNTMNLIVSLGLTFYYATGERLVGLVVDVPQAFELWALGIVPLSLSAGFFVIPALRAIVEAVRNVGRNRRNARRVALLVLAHGLQTRSVIGTTFVRQTLGLDGRAEAAVERLLLRLARELDGEVVLDTRFDAGAEPTTRVDFARAHRELKAVERERAELDPSAFALKPLVYDTSAPP